MKDLLIWACIGLAFGVTTSVTVINVGRKRKDEEK